MVDNGNGLDMHVLEAGEKGRPVILLLHGFPELAYSWRKVMPALADAGYHAIAPDQRGYGLTTGWDPDYDGDLASFRFLNLLRDTLGLLAAMGIDPIWFGVIFVIMIECALITPPVGLNLYVIQSVAKTSLGNVSRGVLPFLALMLFTVVVLYMWPDLALYIPFKW